MLESLIWSFFIKKKLQHMCFPVYIAKFYEILKNICERLLLQIPTLLQSTTFSETQFWITLRRNFPCISRIIFTFKFFVWKVCLFGSFLVRIFPHSDWIRRDILSEYGENERVSFNFNLDWKSFPAK